jgi:elongation factor G
LSVEPLPSSEGFAFESLLRARDIPEEYLAAVERGCRQAMESGILAGYRMVDVRVTLLAAEVDEESSSELAFKVAGSLAFNQALEKAAPVLLEPVMDLEVVVPEGHTGDVVGDLNARVADILEIAARAGGAQAVRAYVPLANMFGYATDLRSMTQGRGLFTMEFHHYAEVEKKRMELIVYGAG